MWHNFGDIRAAVQPSGRFPLHPKSVRQTWRWLPVWVGLVLLLCGFSFSRRSLAQQPGALATQQPTQTDTGKAPPPSGVPHEVWRLQPEQWRLGQIGRDSLPMDLARTARWQETDTLEGWIQTLGYPGKPYLRYVRGLSDYYTHSGPAQGDILPLDPFTGRPSVWYHSASRQLPYYQTRTPFVDARYTQSFANLQLIQAQAGVNITPEWSVSLNYTARITGANYPNFTARHNLFSIGTTYQGRKKRYRMALGFALNRLEDQMNGGVRVDSLQVLNNLYRKGDSPTYARGLLNRNVNELYFYQDYRLNPTDTLKPAGPEHWLYTRFQIQWANRRYQDAVDTLGLSSLFNIEKGFNPFRTYGFLFGDPIRLDERLWVGNHQLQGGYRYVDTTRGLHVRIRAEYGWEFQQASSLWNRAELSRHHGTVHVNLQPRPKTTQSPRQQIDMLAAGMASNRFDPGGTVQLRYTVGLQPVRTVFVDTLLPVTLFRRRKPRPRTYVLQQFRHELETGGRLASLNPTLQWAASQSLSLWGADARGITLRNELTGQVWVRYRWNGAQLARKKALPVLANYLMVEPFLSVLANRIYGDALGQVAQFGGQEVFAGVRLAGRVRFWRFYAEADQSLQRNLTGLAGFQDVFPLVQGRAQLYFQDWLFKRAAEFHFGIEGHWHTEHAPLAMDPNSEVWFPRLRALAPAYIRLDVVLSIRLRTAILFFRAQHLNEGLGTAGYWLTPYYPMMGRQFMLGVRWKLFE